jgi:hypothetical protein
MILVTIAGMEVAHLVHPFAALAVMGIACIGAVAGYIA